MRLDFPLPVRPTTPQIWPPLRENDMSHSTGGSPGRYAAVTCRETQAMGSYLSEESSGTILTGLWEAAETCPSCTSPLYIFTLWYTSALLVGHPLGGWPPPSSTVAASRGRSVYSSILCTVVTECDLYWWNEVVFPSRETLTSTQVIPFSTSLAWRVNHCKIPGWKSCRTLKKRLFQYQFL